MRFSAISSARTAPPLQKTPFAKARVRSAELPSSRPDKRMKRFPFLAVLALLLAGAPAFAASPLAVVAAENFYGDIARQIGGREASVTSILDNPDADPHLFEASPRAARALAAARFVIANGLGYDPWMRRLLAAAGGSGRKVISVARLLGRRRGENPHIWYDPKTMPALAKALAAAFERADPAHAALYRRRLLRFEESMAPIAARIAALKSRFAGLPATATEPVFGYMLKALGMRIRNRRFQLAVMNNTEPGALEVAHFENDLRRRRVRLLVYNRQVLEPMAKRMLALAKALHIPVVAVSETLPAGRDYQEWIASELDAVEKALATEGARIRNHAR